MACENPITCYRPATGGPVRFGPAAPQDGKAYITQQIPCGICILCREEQARQWAVRITHESTLHVHNAFATFTLEDKHLGEYNSLDYKGHMQPFWKRLRHHLGELRYYAVGEYGDKTQRPHYHACIFGHAFTEKRRIIRQNPSMLWTSPLLEECWGLGNVSVGALNFQTAAYTASYVTKKLRSKQQYVRVDEETGELIPLEQPKAYASRNPAIGLRWIEAWGNQVYRHDYVVIEGRKQKPPRYYDRWLEKKKGKEKLSKIKDQRKLQAQQTAKSTDARARAQTARARAKSRKKSV